MTKLISTYARSTGLLIDRPDLKEHFYPQPHERYITLQSGGGQNAKVYDMWQEVIALIKPILDANKIAILLLGAKEDPTINGVHDLRGKTTFLQSVYLVKRALLHAGNDSWLAHCAGWNYRPLVALYGSTDPKNHGPYWLDVSKTVLIESHRMGGRPTFIAQEMPKTINFIPPEQVANAILRLLGIGDQFTYTTTYIGALYAHAVLELIPNSCPAQAFCPELPVTVRMDLLFNEDILFNVFQTGRKVHIVTRRAINPQLLGQFRAQVLTYSHEIVPGVDEPPLGYTDTVRSLFPQNHAFFTRATDEKIVADLRLQYLDHIVVNIHRDATKEDYITAALVYLNRPNTPENRLDMEGQLGHHRFKTNRYVLSDGKVHISHAHLASGKAIESMAANTGDVIDDPAFWRDCPHFLISLHP